MTELIEWSGNYKKFWHCALGKKWKGIWEVDAPATDCGLLLGSMHLCSRIGTIGCQEFNVAIMIDDIE